MEFDNKTLVIGALVVGAVVVVLVARGGSGGGGSTIMPLPSADDGSARAQAFGELVGLGRTGLEVSRDLSLGRIQGVVENNRIAAAERASVEESRAQIRMAQLQADAQQSGGFFDFIESIASIALPLVFPPSAIPIAAKEAF